MIDTKEKLIKYIRQQLGEPQITIELTNDQIGTLVDETIGLYTDVAFGDYEETLVIPKNQLPPNFRVYLPQFTSIMAVYNNYGTALTRRVVPTVSIVGMETHNKEVIYHWNNIRRILTITDHQIPEVLLVIGLARYIPNEEFDHIYNETWCKAMAKAKTKQLWGHVVGKYSQSLVGGATINFDRLISEAETEIEQLMEELHDKWVDPAPVFVC